MRTIAEISLEEIEHEMIKRCLVKFKGNRRKTAEVLGYLRANLYRKIKNMKFRFIAFIYFNSGCSFYSFKGSIPAHIKSVYISPIKNTVESSAADF